MVVPGLPHPAAAGAVTRIEREPDRREGAREVIADLLDALSGANQLRRAVAEAMVYGVKNRRQAR